jgi:predicted Na+-dependent transporter
MKSYEEMIKEIDERHDEIIRIARRRMIVAYIVFAVIFLVLSTGLTLTMRACTEEYHDWKQHFMEAANETD